MKTHPLNILASIVTPNSIGFYLLIIIGVLFIITGLVLHFHESKMGIDNTAMSIGFFVLGVILTAAALMSFIS